MGQTCDVASGQCGPSGTSTNSDGGPTVTDLAPPSLSLRLIAGGLGGPGSADGVGPEARFWAPTAVAPDGNGNVFVADETTHTIRRVVVSTGEVSTVAGLSGVSGRSDGVGSDARFDKPDGIVSDGNGNLFVVDNGNNTIRKVEEATGAVSTLAGSATTPQGSADGIGAAARFKQPSGLTWESNGNLFVSDWGSNTIRKVVVATASVSTLAGLAGTSGSTDGTGSGATFKGPRGVAVASNGSLFVADFFNQTVRKVDIATGTVTTLAGTAGQGGYSDGIGAAASFNGPRGLAWDRNGNLFVSDGGGFTIRQIVLATGAVTTFAGKAGQPGSLDGFRTSARFNGVRGLAADLNGNLFIVDAPTIRKVILATGAVSTLAGSPPNSGTKDGVGTAARFDRPLGVAADDKGNVFIADSYNHTIRKVIVPTGEVTTLAGTASTSGKSDGIGPLARFNQPSGVALDRDGNLFVADYLNNAIRKVVIASGEVSTVAGLLGTVGTTDGIGTSARFAGPTGVALDGSGSLFVADRANHNIRKVVLASGEVTTLAGWAGSSGTADGVGSAARFFEPRDVAVDGTGNLFIADYANHTIRKIEIATGSVSTLAGLARQSGGNDGSSTTARFNYPSGLAMDREGNLLVADSGNHTIRKIVLATSEVSTLVGVSTRAKVSPGPLPAGLTTPVGLAVSASGEIFLTDWDENAVLAVR